MYDYGARFYDPSISLWTSVDPLTAKMPGQGAYNYTFQNPIMFNDPTGMKGEGVDNIIYGNKATRKYVTKHITKPDKSSQSKKEYRQNKKNYNADLANIVDRLEAACETFTITDNKALLSGDPDELAHFSHSGDGENFNIVVPNHSSGEKGKKQNLEGGRGATLMEEMFHATQYLDGDVLATDKGLSIADHTSGILVEAKAKIFAANSGMAKLNTDAYIPNFTIPTRMGIIKEMDGDAKKVGLFLLQGTTKTIFSGDKSKTIDYKPSYKPF